MVQNSPDIEKSRFWLHTQLVNSLDHFIFKENLCLGAKQLVLIFLVNFLQIESFFKFKII